MSTTSVMTRRTRILVVASLAAVVAAFVGWKASPRLRESLGAWLGKASSEAGGNDEHAGHEHGHDEHGHDDGNSIKVSPQGLRNIDFRPLKVTLGPYAQTARLPATIVERPGKTQIQVSAPMTGIVTRVSTQEGAAVEPGSPMFELRLTHEDLVASQRDFLKTAESLDVVNREIKRLRSLEQGLVQGNRVRDEEYARQKLEASLKAERQGLVLHGLTDEQIDGILATRKLVQTIIIRAPALTHDDAHHVDHADHAAPGVTAAAKESVATTAPKPSDLPTPPAVGPVPPPRGKPAVAASGHDHSKHNHAGHGDESGHSHGASSAARRPAAHVFHVQKLHVQPGQQIVAGSPFCVLADHCELFVEGRAFEDGIDPLKRALEHEWPVTAHLTGGSRDDQERVGPLTLLYLADHVDLESKAFRFYLALRNEVSADRTAPDGRRYLLWKYRPGQRLEVEIPVALFEKRIVLPIDALVDEGAESYVFRQNGAKFDRVAVHVEHRDRANVVIAGDGALFPGDIVAAKGAYQLQLAIKNKSGGGADPHAGHTH